MDPNNYAKPETFDPARFLNNTKSMMTAAIGKLENQDHYSFGWERTIAVPESGLPEFDSVQSLRLTTTPLPYKIKSFA
ncbi:hypothetical protein INT46_003356 [Mucor plumbeus]|uniref:Uncharacterized protein n=1 Tax=Mucor plumbeus TaxID=97098 RepID=A0A8H7QRH3_9FUNG|nr:hypothetical protein INT46_003356 [Mucor plumbeus]